MSVLHFRNTSNAIRYFKRDDYFQATISVWPDVDCLDMSPRIEDVTPGEGPETFRWNRPSSIWC